MNTEIYLNSEELAFLVPVLERVLNGVATWKVRPQRTLPLHSLELPVYEQRQFDEQMYRHILACRNKLKGIGSSRKLRMNSFELAALGLAARVAMKNSCNVELRHSIARLPNKLEKLRKRGKRAWIAMYGSKGFRFSSARWKSFVSWLRFDILAPEKRRTRPLPSVVAVHREQRQFMRRVARNISTPTTDHKEVDRLADLAKAEVRRKRTPFTMRELVGDEPKAQQYLAEFILKRKGPDLLKPEYLPKLLRASKRASAFHSALKVAIPNSKLQAALGRWIEQEVDPGYFDAVCEEVKYQLLNFEDAHRIQVAAKRVKQVIDSCKPDESDDVDVRSFFGVWAARFLLALSRDRDTALRAVLPAFQEKKARWEEVRWLTQQRKLREISPRQLT